MKISDLVTLSTQGPASVPISQIVTFEEIGVEGHELIMRSINKTHVKRIAKSLGNWPDIECVQIQWQGKECFLLIDGRHRLEAAKSLGMKDIRVTVRSYERQEDIVEHAMIANLHHGLAIQRPKLTEHVIWLHANGYKPDQIASIVELSENTVQRIISRYKAEDDNEMLPPDMMPKSDSQLLIEYLARFHKRVGDKAADVSHEITEAIKDAPEVKQKEYVDSISFMIDVISDIKAG